MPTASPIICTSSSMTFRRIAGRGPACSAATRKNRRSDMALDLLDIRSAALLVIDMQNGFIHEKGTLGISGVDTGRLAKIVPAVKRLVERCEDVGLPVIWTVQQHLAADASRARKKLAAHTAKRKQISCLAGSWDEEI